MEREIINCTYMTTVETINEAEKPKKNSTILSSHRCPYMEFEAVNNNQRWYPKGISKKIMSPKVMEKLKAGKALLGEIDHPEERFNTNSQYVAIATTNLWLDESTNRLMGEFDILDTPNGRIVQTLVDYGYPIGISARARGTSRMTNKGTTIDEKSYMFKTFDIVVDPGFDIATAGLNESEIADKLNAITSNLNESEQEIVKPLLESLSITSLDIYNNELTMQDDVATQNNEALVENNSTEDYSLLESLYQDSLSLIESLTANVSDLSNELSILGDKLIDSRVENNKLQEALDDSISQANRLDESLKSSVSKYIEAKHQIAELETLREDNKSYIDSLETICNESIEIISDLETLRNDNQTKCEELTQMCESLKLENKNIKDGISLNESLIVEESFKKKKKTGFKILSVINESVEENKEVIVDPMVDKILQNLNKKDGK